MTREDFERIYNENVSIVEGFLYSKCRDRALTEELTQETFCRALASLGRYDGSCKISVWLCAIAKHTLYKYYERKQCGTLPDDEPADPLDMDELIIIKERAKNLSAAIDALPPVMRDIVRMRTDGMSFADIAAELHISEVRARVTFHRAKKRLTKENESWK
ncbi:MAG: sigma-70 family RNA polymerase sigma factor [Ruminococcaceae bacterium]|nr:sigma-70 family RNA polymerase sigma factor [Oscillospiraceae bacterium]